MNPLRSSGGHWAAHYRWECCSRSLYLVIKLKSGLQKASARGSIEVNITDFYSGPRDIKPACFQTVVKKYTDDLA